MKKIIIALIALFTLMFTSCYVYNVSEMKSYKEVLPLEDLNNGQYLIAVVSNHEGCTVYESIKYYCHNGYKVVTFSSMDKNNSEYVIFEKIK
jgi:hypothetical protein